MNLTFPGRSFPLIGLCLCAWSGALIAQGAEVRVAQPQTRSASDTLTLTGSVTAERDASLSPRLSGLVDSVAVDAGARVTQGDTLLMLDDTLAELALARAEVAVDEGRTRLEDARRLRDEQETLARDGRIPASTYKSQQAEARLAEAALERLRAEAAEVRERVARHALVAPFDGVIRARLTDPGEWVDTGTAVLELVATDRVRVDVQVPQQYIAVLAEGDEAEVRLDALPDRALSGRIGAMVPVSDAQARTFLARVVVDASEHDRVLPGLSARVTFSVGGVEDRLSIPRDAVTRYPDGTTVVWTVEQGEEGETIAQRRRVALGAARGEAVDVLEGLEADTRVVVRGNERLREGQRIEVLEGGGD